MPQTFENLRRVDHSFHRGANQRQWHRQNVGTEEEMLHMVAQEIVFTIQLPNFDIVVPPPGDYAQEIDLQLARIAQSYLSGHANQRRLCVISSDLSVPAAIKIAHIMYHDHGTQFCGIGCGGLIVPPQFVGEFQPFSDTEWMTAIFPIPYVPLYRCETFITNCLQS